ncbi:MAG: GIY-YIG nuclease family protein [Fuscovulum sp.]|nr:MAG: GIY-YIG nuclease family protein [Fuscovulum sp.]
MAIHQPIRVEGHRPRLNQEAPWSDKAKKSAIAQDRQRAVLYVIQREGSRICKVGRTTQLKQRLLELQRITRFRLNVQFWAEVMAYDASRVETEALSNIWSAFGRQRVSEWRIVEPASAAEAIVNACQKLGVRIFAMGGFPGALDPSMSEVKELLCEPVEFIDKWGRLPREEYAPQARSVSI